MWVASGIVLSLALAIAAWLRSRASTTTYYEGEVYGMSHAAHRGYALTFAGFAAVLLAAPAWPAIAVPALAVLAVAAILYGATFLRGASGEDE